MSYATWALVPLISILIPCYLLYNSSPYFTIVKVVPYHPPPKLPFEGPIAQNERLTHIKRLGEGVLDAPESVVFDDAGNLYAATADGNIYVVYPNETITLFARVGGRPLGMAFDKDHNLIVCDSLKGLLSIHPQTRAITILTAHVGDSPIFFADDVEIAKSGKIYFSDASNIGPIQKGSRWISLTPSLVAVLANEEAGRLLEYDPATKETRVLIDNLVYANGVAISKDEDYVLVAETGRPSIRRYYLTGEKAGQSDYFVENLPAIPDGLDTAEDGRFFVSFFSLRSPLEALHPYTAVKKVVVALLPFLPIVPKRVGFIGVLDQQGNFVDSYWDPSGTTTHTLTDTKERDGKLYMGSLSVPWITVYDLNANRNK